MRKTFQQKVVENSIDFSGWIKKNRFINFPDSYDAKDSLRFETIKEAEEFWNKSGDCHFEDFGDFITNPRVYIKEVEDGADEDRENYKSLTRSQGWRK